MAGAKDHAGVTANAKVSVRKLPDLETHDAELIELRKRAGEATSAEPEGDSRADLEAQRADAVQRAESYAKQADEAEKAALKAGRRVPPSVERWRDKARRYAAIAAEKDRRLAEA